MFPHVRRIWALCQLCRAKISVNSSLSDVSRHFKIMMDIKLASNMPICSRCYLWNCRFKLWPTLGSSMSVFSLLRCFLAWMIPVYSDLFLTLTWTCVLMGRYLRSFPTNICAKFGLQMPRVMELCPLGLKKEKYVKWACICVFLEDACMVLRPSAIVEETSPVTKQPRVSQQSHDHIVPRAIFPQESPQRLPHHRLIFPSANPAP